MKFQQTAKLVDNKSRVGGAIALYGGSGLVVGNISNVSLLRNYAQQDGGAILVDQSEIIMKYGAKMIFTENKAYNGGALALQNGARLIFKSHSQIIFKENDAQQYGGALYVEEPGHKIIRNNRGYWILCFFELSEEISSHAMPSLIFANNTADSAGSSLFGGWGNLCTYSGGKSALIILSQCFTFTELLHNCQQYLLTLQEFAYALMIIFLTATLLSTTSQPTLVRHFKYLLLQLDKCLGLYQSQFIRVLSQSAQVVHQD